MNRTGRRQVLDILERQSASTRSLSYQTGLAEPTIRRKIQQLRERGHNIVYVGGYATLRQPEDEAVAQSLQ